MSAPSLTSKLTSNDGINYINIGLMIISLIAAYIVPFELFLFSYAVLGPLHYLTEISWLDKKSYFIKSKIDVWLLILLVLFISYGVFNSQSKTNLFTGSFIFIGFFYGLIILLIDKTAIKLALIFLLFVISPSLHLDAVPELPFLIFVIWMPTIIHVYIFTGAFILFGALKSKSLSGIISLLIFVACAFTFFIYMPENFGHQVSDYGRVAYGFFKSLNGALMVF